MVTKSQMHDNRAKTCLFYNGIYSRIPKGNIYELQAGNFIGIMLPFEEEEELGV
jgi:hypothetical protein